MKKETNTTTKGELLQDKISDSYEFYLRLNEGEEDECIMTLGQYIASFDEGEGIEDYIMPVLNLGEDETFQFGADFIRRISPPKNERQKLLDSNKQMVELLHNLRYDLYKYGEIKSDMLPLIDDAINNAKNIQP
jgi:hypothetical protein